MPLAAWFASLYAPPVRPLRVILAASVPFWAYLTLNNIFIYEAFVLEGATRMSIAHPLARTLQHLLLLPLVVLAYRWAWRVGWPAGRRFAAAFMHIGIALGFAACARLAMNIALDITAPLLHWPEEAKAVLQTTDRYEYTLTDWFIGEYPLWRRATTEFLFVYWFGLALVVGLRVYLELLEQKVAAARLRGDWLKARLDALAGQLNPHFLFNSLHTVASFVRADPDRAEKMVADLSQLLRSTLRERDRPFASIGEELEFIERYLQIERTRFEDRLTTHIEASGPVLNARVPSLLLQPLIENAIKHGVSRSRGPARIDLQVSREGDRLRVLVRNTWRPGEGEAEPVGEHIGLRNVRERLEALYGTDHSMVSQAVGEAWEVTIVIPYRDRIREAQA